VETSNAVPSYSGPERRKHRRYIVRGRVRFLVDSMEVWGELVNFGGGGMQIRSRFELIEGAKLKARVMAFCYPSSFEVKGKVVGGKDALVSIQFVDKPEAVSELLLWLEQEHFPWTGGSADCPADEPERSPAASEAEELVYQQA
jgi:hypothetical protein